MKNGVKEYFGGLHGLRGLSVLAVFVLHVVNFAVLDGWYPLDDVPLFVTRIMYSGYVGVYTFFVLSGFLICFSLSDGKSIHDFIVSRMSRIYPAFFVLHLLIFFVGPIAEYKFFADISFSDWLLHFCTNLLMLPGALNLPRAQPVAWTLSFEMLFYVTSASLVWIYGRSKELGLAVGLVVAVLLLLPVIPILPVMRFFLPGMIYFFMRTQIDRFFERYSWLDFPSVYFATMWIGWGITYVETRESAAGITNVAILALHLGLSSMAILAFQVASIVAAICFLSGLIRNQGGISWLLNTRPFHFLGTISYSLYLWHTLIMYGLRKALPAVGLKDGPLVAIYIVGSIILSLIVSILSYRLVERPGAAWMRSTLSRHRSGPIPVAGELFTKS